MQVVLLQYVQLLVQLVQVVAFPPAEKVPLAQTEHELVLVRK